MSNTQPSPEQTLHNEFCLYGAFYLSAARAGGEPVDPKIYETIYKYLGDRDLAEMPTPDEGSVAERELDKLKEELKDA